MTPSSRTGEGFALTRWTLVERTRGVSPEARQALSELCAAYYEPVVAFLRREGRDPDASRELAHEFFAAVLKKPALGGAEPGRGRFRSYLLGALKHHVSHRREAAGRQKRGGGAETIPLDPGTDTSPGVDPRDAQTLPPDREFDRQWALHVLRRAMTALETARQREGKAEEFQLLKPFIAGDSEHAGLAQVAAQHGLNAATLRKTLSRLRQEFRRHVKAEIAPTLAADSDAADEMRELLLALTP